MLVKFNKLLNTKNKNRLNTTVFISEDRTIKISDLQNDICSIINLISTIKQDKWLLAVNDGYYFLVAMIALCSLNKSIVITSNLSKDWMSDMADCFDAILTDHKNLTSFNKKCVDLPDILCTKSVVKFTFQIKLDINADLFLFTSGSSGKVKKINKKLFQLVNECEVIEKLWGRHFKSTIIAASVSHLHIYGLIFKLLWPVLTGKVILRQMIRYPEQLHFFTKMHSICFISSPAFLNRLDDNLNLSNIRICFSSGGFLSLESALKYSSITSSNVPLEIYGSTETGGIGYRFQKKSDTLWTLLPGVHLHYDLNKILLNSDFLKKNECIVLDDYVKLYDNNMFQLLGRADRIVKIEEKRVSLDQLENYLRKSSLVNDVYTLLIHGKRNIIGCVIILSPQGKTSLLLNGEKWLKRNFRDYMALKFEAATLPRKIRFVDNFLQNNQSKIIPSHISKLFH